MHGDIPPHLTVSQLHFTEPPKSCCVSTCSRLSTLTGYDPVLFCSRSLYLVCTRFKESVSVSEHEISRVDNVHETLHVSSAPSSLFLGASN